RRHDDPVDTQLGAHDLLLDGDQALPDLGGGGLHGGDRLAAGDLQPHPGGRVVVEALGEPDVLVGHRVADAAHDPLAVRGVGDPARQVAQVPLRPRLGRQGQVADLADQLGHRSGRVDELAGDVDVALAHAVAGADLDPVDPAGVG